MLKKIAIVVGIILVLFVGGFVFWASSVNPIMPGAQAALISDAQVQVTEGEWLVFQPTGAPPETGLIVYPGGKVDYRAYAPYARAVARQGYLVVIPKMPLNLAVFNPYAAYDVIDAYPTIRHWAVGGHSLGGSMAANFAAQDFSRVEGLVLLAAYPAQSDDLTSKPLKTLSIYASNDGLATIGKIEASRALLPKGTEYILIKGGNHAQFGDYGVQANDGTAEINRTEQQAQAVAATAALLKSLEEK